MTDENQGSDNSELNKISAMIEAQEAGTQVEPQAAEEESPVEQAPEAAPETPKEEEKLIPQSQVAKIAAREKREAEQKMQALIQQQRMQYESEMAALKAAQGVSANQSGQPIDQAQIAKAIQQEVQRMAQFNQAYQIAEQFEGKMKSAILTDPDLGDIYDSINIQKFPDFAVLANQFDNTAEIVREVGLHPEKLVQINALIQAGVPELARKALANLSTSIKQNQSAKSQASASPPLSQLKPSSGIGVSDDNKSVADFRKIYGRKR